MVTTAPINTLPTASAIAAAAVTAKLTALEAQQPIKVERPPSAVVSEPQMAAIPPPGLATTVVSHHGHCQEHDQTACSLSKPMANRPLEIMETELASQYSINIPFF